MGIGCSADQGVVVTACAARRCHLHQGAVVRCICRMGDFPRTRMAGGAVAAAGRDTGSQVRNARMAKGAIIYMCYGNCGIRSCTRIVTGHA
jgi:hypothetical protein